MGTSYDSNNEYENCSVKQIVNSAIAEDSRLAGISDPGFLEELATQLGVKDIQHRPLAQGHGNHPGIDAMLIPVSNGYSVVINDKVTAARQRYSLAHELGHIILLANEPFPLGHKGSPQYRSATDMKRDEENLCDEIAAELLMPQKLFREGIDADGRSLENVPKWANVYKTSLTATAIRYRDLLPEPCHLIKWRKSLLRKRVISLDWQKRNRVPGPSLQPLGDLKGQSEFRSVQESWSTLGNSRSSEKLLVRYWKGNRTYLNAQTFQTESIGFGTPKIRTVLSMVYLGRKCED